jgi:phosphinothricin acetyltransferase
MVPRTLDEQVQWIDEHSGGHPAVVAELDGGIVGFGSVSTFRPRPAYATTVEDSVYLLADHQGKGIGRRCWRSCSAWPRPHGFHSVIARITGARTRPRSRSTRAVRLRDRGHRARGRPQFGQWLDVVEMQHML